MKGSYTDLNMKLEVKCFCEASNSTERETERQCRFASLTHFTTGTEHIQTSSKPGEAPKESKKYGYHQFEII